MDWVVVAGVVSFGAIVGWMGCILYFGSRDIRTFTAIIGVFGGTVILGFFKAVAGPGVRLPREVWLYPVGLLAGIAVSSVLYGYQFQQEQAAKKRELEENARQGRILADIEAHKKQLEDAKNTIVAHIKNKKGPRGKTITMISFGRLRDDLNRPDLTDEHFYEIIDQYPTELCRKKLTTGRGLGLTHS